MLIGLTGPKGVGKSVAAAYLEEMGFDRLSFAGPIKAMLTAGFGIDFATLSREAKESPLRGLGLTPRRLMQTLGTEWGRSLDPELWLKLMGAQLDLRGPYYDAVIDDVRFDNEAELVHARGGTVLAVTRAGFAPAEDGHCSEAGVSPRLVHATLDFTGLAPGSLEYGRYLASTAFANWR